MVWDLAQQLWLSDCCTTERITKCSVGTGLWAEAEKIPSLDPLPDSPVP